MADMVFDYVHGAKRVGRNKINFRCPICGDGKKSKSHRGWFYIDSGSYFCWNAGCRANEHAMSGINFLMEVSGLSYAEIKSELIKRAGTFTNAIKEEKRVKDLFEDEIEEKHEFEGIFREKINDGIWIEELPKWVTDYINKRKLLKAPFLPKGFKFLYDRFEKRLVIPWTKDYYQARALLKEQELKEKYKFPSNIEKPLFGLDTINENFKYIFILEGVFDSIWIPNGIASGSLRLSNSQKTTLAEYEDKGFTLVYMMDNMFKDNSGKDFALKIIENEPYKKIFIWPNELRKFKDVNESIISSDEFIDIWKNQDMLIKNSFNGVMAKLKMK